MLSVVQRRVLVVVYYYVSESVRRQGILLPTQTRSFFVISHVVKEYGGNMREVV